MGGFVQIGPWIDRRACVCGVGEFFQIVPWIGQLPPQLPLCPPPRPEAPIYPLLGVRVTTKRTHAGIWRKEYVLKQSGPVQTRSVRSGRGEVCSLFTTLLHLLLLSFPSFLFFSTFNFSSSATLVAVVSSIFHRSQLSSSSFVYPSTRLR